MTCPCKLDQFPFGVPNLKQHVDIFTKQSSKIPSLTGKSKALLINLELWQKLSANLVDTEQ